MTDLTPPPPAPAAPVAPVASGPRKNTAGLVSLILAIVAFITAVIPGASFATWALAIAAIIFGIVGLTGNRRPRITALIGLILSIVSWIVAIIVSIAFISAAAVGGLNAAASALPTDIATLESSAPETPAPSDSPSEAPSETPSEGSTDASGSDHVAIGDKVKNDDGVTFSVTAVKCGMPTSGTSFLKEKAKGEFCQVKFTIDNGSSDSVNISEIDVTGQIGSATYDSNSSNDKFGDDYFSTDINPGLTAKSVMYFDVPKGKSLDTVTYDPAFTLFTGPVVVSVK